MSFGIRTSSIHIKLNERIKLRLTGLEEGGHDRQEGLPRGWVCPGSMDHDEIGIMNLVTASFRCFRDKEDFCSAVMILGKIKIL